MTAPATPFAALGGAPIIAAIVNRFYDLMDQDRAYAELRAMHGDDLAPMRASLTGWLSAWSGGPRDWFADRPGTCIMSLHRSLSVTPETARQWREAMDRAIADQPGLDPALGDQLREMLGRMAIAMAA